MPAEDRTSQTIRLRDGRQLGFAEYGDLTGKPLLLFAGASSRYFRPNDDRYTESVGLRLIAVERPGFGLSDFQPGRTVRSWPDDVTQLADQLDIDRFSILGVSQGGPYALACAYTLPDRLVSTTLVSSIAPFTVPGLNKENGLFLRLLPILSKSAPFMIDLMMGLTARMAARSPDRFVRQMLKSLPPEDQAILRLPDVMMQFTSEIPEIYRQGARGTAQDVKLVTRPWGFALEEIPGRVFVWQGDKDPNATPAMGRYLCQTIPGCEATFVPNAGHLMLFNLWPKIAGQIVAAWAQEPPPGS